jgi:hypothetical protein
MDEISNKTLATLLVVAIVVSLAGTFFAMRGVSTITNVLSGAASSDTGEAKVFINETQSIILTADTVNFGAGYRNSTVVADNVNCTLTSSLPKPPCWVDTPEGSFNASDFTLENDGNVFVNVTINSTVGSDYFNSCDSETLVIDATPNFYFKGKLLSSSGCDEPADGSDLDGTDGVENAFTGSPQLLCANLSSADAEDDFNITLTLDVPTGPAGNCDNNVIFQAVRST